MDPPDQLLLTLSSRLASSSNGGMNSDVTFQLQNPISLPMATGSQSSKTAAVSLWNFTGVNSLSNIIKGVNDTFKINSTWYNYNTNAIESTTVSITIPQGYWSQPIIQTYLCQNMYFPNTNNYVYGFGNNTTYVDPTTGLSDYAYPGVSSLTEQSRFIVQQFPDILTQTFAGQKNSHE